MFAFESYIRRCLNKRKQYRKRNKSSTACRLLYAPPRTFAQAQLCFSPSPLADKPAAISILHLTRRAFILAFFIADDVRTGAVMSRNPIHVASGICLARRVFISSRFLVS